MLDETEDTSESSVVESSSESKLIYNINNLPDELVEERKIFDQYIIKLNEAWLDFDENPNEENCNNLKEIYKIYMEYKKFERFVDISMIIYKLFYKWDKTKEKIYLELLMELFPDNVYYSYLFIKKFMHKPGLNSFKAIKSIKKNCSDKDGLNTKIKEIRKRFIRKLLFFPLAPLYSIRKRIKRHLVRKLIKQGFSSFMAYEWFRIIREDLKKEKAYSIFKKIWCFRRGFRPWRIHQYDLTKENYKNILSDRDYCYLHEINNSFVKWINDKVTFRYILMPFKDYLPKYYFQILSRYGNKKDVVPLIDCPPGIESNYDGIIDLLREKGDLAFKMSSGTHGIGFYRLSYRNGVYFINNKFCHISDIIKLFESRKVFYIVTEYIKMHNDFLNIYPNSVNTIRVMVINEDGISPFIGHAFMRIGSSTTGATDNIGFGGVFAKVNTETGEYYDGEQVINHVITKCPEHPDTGVKIEGTIPHWNIVIDNVLLMCKLMPQLEYMGFDIAITENGFVVLEINVHQDLHRYPMYCNEVKDYLFRKLEQKQLRYKGRYKRI